MSVLQRGINFARGYVVVNEYRQANDGTEQLGVCWIYVRATETRDSQIEQRLIDGTRIFEIMNKAVSPMESFREWNSKRVTIDRCQLSDNFYFQHKRSQHAIFSPFCHRDLYLDSPRIARFISHISRVNVTRAPIYHQITMCPSNYYNRTAKHRFHERIATRFLSEFILPTHNLQLSTRSKRDVTLFWINRALWSMRN